MLDNLKLLKLALEPPEEGNPHDIPERPRLQISLPRLLSFLRAAHNIETLSLSLSYDAYIEPEIGESIFAALVEEVSSGSEHRALRKIKHLEPGHFGFHLHDLLRFVRLTRSTLKRMDVREVPEIMEMDDSIGPRWAQQVREAYGGDDLRLDGHFWAGKPSDEDSQDDDLEDTESEESNSNENEPEDTDSNEDGS